MSQQFKIRYRVHRNDRIEEFEDTKEETVLLSSGEITVRRYDHHGPDGHYRLIEKVKGRVCTESVEQLYEELLEIICHHVNTVPVDGKDMEVILTEDGLSISADGGLSGKNQSCEKLIEAFLEKVML